MKKYLVLAAQLLAFMLLMSLIMLGLVLGAEFALKDVMPQTFLYSMLVQEVAMLIAALLAAFVIIRFWEKKPFSDLGFSFLGRGKDLLWGTLTAVFIYAVGFAVSLLAGWVKIVDVGFYAHDFFLSLLLMIFVGMAEEVISRGFILGRMLNVGMHPMLALLISALIFAAMHLGNNGVTALSMVNLTLAGMLLGATYLYTRNLAFPIALHTFWNWIQGSVLGYAVSGTDSGKPVFDIALNENTLMNGGEFGFEGSLVCTILEVVMLFVVLRYMAPNLKYDKRR